MFDQVLRSTGEVAERRIGRHAEEAVQRRMHFAKVNRSIGNLAAETIGSANHLSATEAATGDQSPSDLRPMVATGVGVDSRRAAKLAPGDNSHIVEHAAFIKVADQCRQCPFEDRQVGVLGARRSCRCENPSVRSSA